MNDVAFTPTGEGGTTSLLVVKQREPIQYWQLVFGPRDCGCMAPGMPSSPVPSRRTRFAPFCVIVRRLALLIIAELRKPQKPFDTIALKG